MLRLHSRVPAPAILALTLCLSACGGGGGGGGSSPALPGGAPTTTSAGAGPTAQAKITIDLPGSSSSSTARAGTRTTAARRSPQFVDTTNGTQLVVTIATVNGVAYQQTTAYAVGTAVTCPSSVCTLITSLPTGTDVLQFTVEDANNEPLGQSEVTANVVQTSTTNTISTTMNGIVSTLSNLACGATTFQSDGDHLPVTWHANDFDGVAIASPGIYAATSTNASAALANPLTISSSNAQTKFSVNGGVAANPATINAPADVVTLIYSGPSIASTTTIPITLGASVTASIPGFSVAQTTATCSPTTNSTISTEPSTTLSGTAVTDSGTWTLANGVAGSQPNSSNADCFAPPFVGSILINDAECSYNVSGTWTAFTATTGGTYNLTYTGNILLSYWTTALQTTATATGTYLFVDTNNSKNTFTGTLTSTTFAPTASPTSAPATGTLTVSGTVTNPATASVTLTSPTGTTVVASIATSAGDSASLTTFASDLVTAINASAAGSGSGAFVIASNTLGVITIQALSNSLAGGTNGNAITFVGGGTSGATFTPSITTLLSGGLFDSSARASVTTPTTTGTALSWTISGTGGAFAGVSGTLSEARTSNTLGFGDSQDPNLSSQFDYPSSGATIPVTGTLNGI